VKEGHSERQHVPYAEGKKRVNGVFHECHTVKHEKRKRTNSAIKPLINIKYVFYTNDSNFSYR